MSEYIKIRILGDAKNAKQAFKQAQAAAETSFVAIGIASAAAAAALVAVESAVISTSAQFERFTVQLETIEGSSQKAEQSMAWITDFAKTTPYELAGVTEAFVQLKAYGIDPVDGTLRTLGDTAAAMGKPLSQGVEALADAMTGEFERLKEFGIKASVVGDEVAFAYTQNGQQMTATANKNSQQMIQATLQGIWNDKYAGGMDKLSQTWDGKVANLADNWSLFQKQIGDEGAFLAAKNVLGLVLEELDKNDTAVTSLAGSISDVLVDSMQVAVFAANFFAKSLDTLDVGTSVIQLGFDSAALVVLQLADAYYAALQARNEWSLAISDSDAVQQELDGFIEEREKIARLINVTKEGGAKHLDELSNAEETLNEKWRERDALSFKFFNALESGRAKAKAALAASKDAIDPPTEPNKPGKDKPDPAVAIAAAQADAQKVIDIHGAKWREIQKLAAVAGEDESSRLLAQNDMALEALFAEQDRLDQALAAQGASATQRESLETYYDDLRLNRAQETVDALAEIDILAREEQRQRIYDGEDAAYQLKGQFQQLFTDNQQVNLSSMLTNITAYSQASADWDKWTGKQKLGFAASTFGALSGLMASESKKQFEIGKIAARAENAVHTYLAATKALSTLGPIAGPIAATVMVGAGLANDQKIASAQFGSGASGGVTMPTTSAGGGDAAPTTAINPNTGLAQSTNQPAAPQAIQLNVTVDALDPSKISYEVKQGLAQAITPAVAEQFTDGFDLQVMA